MKKCYCYDLKPVSRHIYSQHTGELLNTQHGFVGVCLGTKERNECSCGGDREKCDFYPEYRKKSVTNAEKIRSMSDEELADELAKVASWDRKEFERAKRIGLKKFMFDWLNKPAEA